MHSRLFESKDLNVKTFRYKFIMKGMNHMDFFDSMRAISEMVSDVDSQEQQQMYSNPTSFAAEFSSFKAEPVLYPNATQYISPYAYDNWGGVTGIIASFDESTRSPGTIIENKIDPNKIYSAELAALRSSAADQVRITKLFEKKLMEGLRDKDKFGLNENDIEAMQALTAARSAVTGINKEMINIKKNISELRLKQQQQQTRMTQPSNGGDVLPTTASSMGESTHEILDRIFESASHPVDLPTVQYDPNVAAQEADNASSLLNSMVSNPLDPYTRHESMNPQTYVVLGDNDDDTEFATYSESTGELLDDYPNPVANLVKIDRNAGIAVDEFNREYPLRMKD